MYLAIKWVRELGFKDVIFELDAKLVVDAFNSPNVANNEFGCLVEHGHHLFLFSFFSDNSHVEFASTNSNKVAHILVGVALFSASP